MLKRFRLPGAVLGLALTATLAAGAAPAFAADPAPYIAPPVAPPPPAGPPPAVSQVNAKLDIAAGLIRFGGPPAFTAFRAQGAISIPLGYSFGLQLDASATTALGLAVYSFAEHLFWRNPDVALAGFYGSWSNFFGLTRWRAAGQAEAYLGPFSLEAIVGVEGGFIPTGLFAITDVAFYPVDDLRLSVGFRHDFLRGNLFAAGAEFQFASGPSVGASLYVEGEFNPVYQQVFGGVRLYIGDDKSLIERHREDDPRIQSDIPICSARGSSITSRESLCDI